jgi:putative peptide zinc metalloprotease protein
MHVTASAETFTGSPAIAGGPASGSERIGAAASSPAAVPAVPALAADIELLGEVSGSGYRRAPALVRRGDGQTVQLTPLLYQLLTVIDGKRGFEELAQAFSERCGRLATAEDVRFLTEAKLRPLGLLRRPDGTEPVVKKANPLLALRLKLVASNPAVTNRIAALFTPLFRLPVVLAVIAGFAIATWWVMVETGLAAAAHEALYQPEMLLLVFALTLLSAAFHEVGHAAACRYSGARPGAMGMGLYLVWPAFYTDVTDAYRLPRKGRLRVDLGGLYFNAIFGIAMLGLWALVGWDALLLVVAAQPVQMIRQLIPVVRFDGYHILADLTGVPDLFHHIKPTLLGLIPRRGRARNPLKAWVRTVVTLWVFIVVPILAALFLFLILMAPRFVATAWDSIGLKWNGLEASWDQGDVYAVMAAALSILTISLPVFGSAYFLSRLIRRTSRGAWRRTTGHPTLRAGLVFASMLMATGLAWAWWPGDQYRPIQPNEHLALDSPVWPAVNFSFTAPPSAPPPAAPAPAAVSPAAGGQWMVVVLPNPAAGGGGVAPPVPTQPGTRPDWPFWFDPPAPPAEGDNQAMAVNTTDGSSVFDSALALVWVTDGSDVDQTNQAWALASCNNCDATAVSFQVIVVIGYTQVITPTNTAVAVNYLCAACLTQAIALQGIVTLPSMPDETTLANLSSVWSQLEQLNESFHLLPLNEVYSDLVAAQTQIFSILGGTVTTTVNGTTTAITTTTDGTTTIAPAGETTTTTGGDTTTSDSTSTSSGDGTTSSSGDETTGTTTDDGTAGTTTDNGATTTTDESTTSTDAGATTTDDGSATGEPAGTTTTSP